MNIVHRKINCFFYVFSISAFLTFLLCPTNANAQEGNTPPQASSQTDTEKVKKVEKIKEKPSPPSSNETTKKVNEKKEVAPPKKQVKPAEQNSAEKINSENKTKNEAQTTETNNEAESENKNSENENSSKSNSEKKIPKVKKTENKEPETKQENSDESVKLPEVSDAEVNASISQVKNTLKAKSQKPNIWLTVLSWGLMCAGLLIIFKILISNLKIPKNFEPQIKIKHGSPKSKRKNRYNLKY